MAIIRFINTTTALRVDEALESAFFRIVDPAFKKAIERQSRDRYVDVQIVSRDDEDLARDDTSQRDGIPDTDVLGIYVYHDQSSHHPTIKVCPERILDACQRWNHKIGGALPFAERYPTLLHAVIIHELAHFLMDEQLIADQCRLVSWSEFIRRLSCDAAASDATEWTNVPVRDDECEKSLRQIIETQKHAQCGRVGKSRDRLTDKYPIVLQPLHESQHMIEESLANAFILNQAFGEGHLAALRVFINSQSAPPYKAGLRWTGDIARVLETASSWRGFKGSDIGIDGRTWVAARADRREILTGLAQRLGNSQEAIVSFDFQKEA
jgi:hypothetical protein